MLFAVLGLGACAAPPALPRDVSPQEAGAIVAAATNTAAAAGTSVALATATDVAARATATAGRAATLDALGIEQTRAAVSVTQLAAAAGATDAAAQRTQVSRGTQVAQTPTAAARSTQAALDAQREARAQHAAQTWADFRDLLMSLSLILGACYVAARIVVAFVEGLMRVRVERERLRAEIARDTLRLLEPGHYGGIVDGTYQVLPLPVRLDEPPTLIEHSAPPHDHAWRVGCLQAVMYAERYGWTFEALGPAGVHVMDRPDWERVTDYLTQCDVLLKRPRSRTQWAGGMTPERARDSIRRGLPLPYPKAPPPRVTSPRRTDTQPAQMTQNL